MGDYKYHEGHWEREPGFFEGLAVILIASLIVVPFMFGLMILLTLPFTH